MQKFLQKKWTVFWDPGWFKLIIQKWKSLLSWIFFWSVLKSGHKKLSKMRKRWIWRKNIFRVCFPGFFLKAKNSKVILNYQGYYFLINPSPLPNHPSSYFSRSEKYFFGFFPYWNLFFSIGNFDLLPNHPPLFFGKNFGRGGDDWEVIPLIGGFLRLFQFLCLRVLKFFRLRRAGRLHPPRIEIFSKFIYQSN